MAMETCGECGNEVSTRAEICPKCGAVLKKKTGCFKYVGAGILLLVIIGVIGSLMDSSNSISSNAPKITASLSKFFVDRSNAQFVFTLDLSNQEAQEHVVYVVVYGKNDDFTPPRRDAWPSAGLLFRQAGTSRGILKPSDITRGWNSRPENTKGMKIILKSNASKSLEGAFIISDTCQQKAWRGQTYKSGSMYNEMYLWIFSQKGQLIFKKKYKIK